jgi:hypothetical protein
VQIGPDSQAVHQQEHGLREIDVEQRFGGGKLEDFAGLEEAIEALLAEFEKMVAQGLHTEVFAAREERVPARPRRQFEEARGHFVDGVLADPRAAVGAKGLAHAGVEEAKKIVALGGSSDGGTRIPRGILLPDSDGRRDAIDLVDLGLFHALQELARVGRERFHIAPLPLGVDGVEGQRRLPRPGNTGHHGELVMGNRKRNVLQVVDSRTANPNEVLHGSFQYNADGKRRPFWV